MTCIATKPYMNSENRRGCGKKAWRESVYCYQHAISFGDAFVVRPADVAAAIHIHYCSPEDKAHPSVEHGADEVTLAGVILKAASA